jgi:hypothetical protein
MTEPATGMEAYVPIIGRWRSSGVLFDADGREQGTMSGTDAYEWLPGGAWVIHQVDVTMGGERIRAIELQGGWDETTGTWTWRAFDGSGAYDEYAVHEDGGSFLAVDAAGSTRTRLTPAGDGRTMAALWERRDGDDGWRRWIEMRLELSASPRHA